ncbi:MAG: AIR synthase-related protein [Thaumarchaeota archaeon]|nr:AIR synthase-related protein [Nitrososphaerota archaeon]
MEEVVYPSLGSRSPHLKVGPGVGFDNSVISLGEGHVMILTVDPVSAIPALGMKLSAWLSVHLIASDYTTSGNDPEFATFAFNFPPAMPTSDREDYVRAIGRECKELEIAVAGGHTGSYPGGGFTVIGAGSMLGFSTDDGYVTPAMARIGDSILMTKHAGIEATASLALSFPKRVERLVGRRLANRARKMISLCTTVADARAARRVGLGSDGITSMHDATEGGVLGALGEMATASGKSYLVETDKIPVSDEARKVCAAFGIDPLLTMGEGALLITCRPEHVSELKQTMASSSIPIEEVGRVNRGKGLAPMKGGLPMKFKPGIDRYWPVYDRALRQGLN